MKTRFGVLIVHWPKSAFEQPATEVLYSQSVNGDKTGSEQLVKMTETKTLVINTPPCTVEEVKIPRK